MSHKNISILFLGKDEYRCREAQHFCLDKFEQVDCFFGKWGDPLPDSVKTWEGDLIISYLSRWILPKKLLEKAKLAAINFHPATPDYPGVGCNNFALYDEVSEFGATCHHMDENVDKGQIIRVKRFPVLPEDTVETLLERTYDNQLLLFYDIISEIMAGNPLPQSNETWTRKPFTRKQLNCLATITPEMSKAEVERRIRATTFRSFKPIMLFQGFTFELKDKVS